MKNDVKAAILKKLVKDYGFHVNVKDSLLHELCSHYSINIDYRYMLWTSSYNNNAVIFTYDSTYNCVYNIQLTPTIDRLEFSKRFKNIRSAIDGCNHLIDINHDIEQDGYGIITLESVKFDATILGLTEAIRKACPHFSVVNDNNCRVFVKIPMKYLYNNINDAQGCANCYIYITIILQKKGDVDVFITTPVIHQFATMAIKQSWFIFGNDEAVEDHGDFKHMIVSNRLLITTGIDVDLSAIEIHGKDDTTAYAVIRNKNAEPALYKLGYTSCNKGYFTGCQSIIKMTRMDSVDVKYTKTFETLQDAVYGIASISSSLPIFGMGDDFASKIKTPTELVDALANPDTIRPNFADLIIDENGLNKIWYTTISSINTYAFIENEDHSWTVTWTVKTRMFSAEYSAHAEGWEMTIISDKDWDDE